MSDTSAIERQLEERRDRCAKHEAAFLNLPRGNAHKSARRTELVALRDALLGYLETFESLIPLRKQDRALAEQSVKVLDEVAGWYRTLFTNAEKAGLEKENLRPNSTNFTNAQRLVAEHESAQVQKLRERFIEAGLPVDGFLTGTQPGDADAAKSSYAASLWEKIVATVCAVVVLGAGLYGALRPQGFSDPTQFAILSVLLSPRGDAEHQTTHFVPFDERDGPAVAAPEFFAVVRGESLHGALAGGLADLHQRFHDSSHREGVAGAMKEAEFERGDQEEVIDRVRVAQLAERFGGCKFLFGYPRMDRSDPDRVGLGQRVHRGAAVPSSREDLEKVPHQAILFFDRLPIRVGNLRDGRQLVNDNGLVVGHLGRGSAGDS